MHDSVESETPGHASAIRVRSKIDADRKDGGEKQRPIRHGGPGAEMREMPSKVTR